MLHKHIHSLRKSALFSSNICMQVVGFDDPVKVSKRVHFQAVEQRPPRAAACDVVRPLLPLDAPVRCAKAAHVAGIEFEAHIPMAAEAMTQML